MTNSMTRNEIKLRFAVALFSAGLALVFACLSQSAGAQTGNTGLLGLTNPVYIPTIAAGSTIQIYPSVQNVGNTPLNLTGFAFTGPFTLNQNLCGTVLAQGASCLIVVDYSPLATSSPITGSMQVTHTGGNSPFAVNFSAAGTSLSAPIIASTFNPASVAVGNAVTALVLTMNNNNGVPLTNVNVGLNLPGLMVSASTPNPSTTCGGNWFAASWIGGGSPANRTGLEFLGGTIPANGQCVISIAVVSSSVPGIYPGPSSISFTSAEISDTFPTTSLTITPPPTAPNAPTDVSAAPGDRQATISFAVPTYNGRSPITGYDVVCNGITLQVPSQIAPVSLKGLSNGTTYSCFVTARNAVGASPPSPIVEVTPSAMAPLFLVAVQSRKTHAGAGPFDLRIDPMLPVTVEPRRSAAGHSIVFQFNVPISSLDAVAVTDLLGGDIGSASATRSGSDVLVAISGVSDKSRAAVTLTGVNGETAPYSVAMGFLAGDANSTGSVNASDISGAKAQMGQTTNATSFKFDVNSSGTVGSLDIAAVKSQSGSVLPTATLPSISIALSANTVFVNTPVTLTWSSTNATSCTASGSWRGAQLLSGTITVTPTVGGQFKYSIQCAGAGGSMTKYASLVVPLPVYLTSYENYKLLSIGPQNLSRLNGGNSRAFADFEQVGKLSYLVHTLEYVPPSKTQFGQVFIYRINDDGTTTDISSQLIEGDRHGCLHPRKALVADFNKDGKPDVFFACHGYDNFDRLPQDGEMPYMLLSQPNGKYKLSKVDYGGPVPYNHSATAADLDGDGYPDVVVADHNANNLCQSPLYILANNKDGTFTKDASNFPEFNNCGNSRAVWSTELIDINGDGHLELWAAGQDAFLNNGGLQSSVYAMVSPAKFSSVPMLVFPSDMNWTTPLDMIFKGNIAYALRVNAAYSGYAIQHINLTTLAANIILTNTVTFDSLGATRPECIGFGGAWIDFIRIFNNKIVTDDTCRSPNLGL